MKLIPVFFALLIFSMIITPAYAEIIQLITKNGNIIPVEVPQSQKTTSVSTGNGAGNGTAMINGMGINARMIDPKFYGHVTYGSGVLGEDESIKPYMPVASTTDFEGVIIDGDVELIYSFPEFSSEYTYDGTRLNKVNNIIPNILGFGEQRNVSGDIATTISNSEGIIFSGTGITILKLNSYADQPMFLKGNATDGKIRLVEMAPYDYMAMDYNNGLGFNVLTEISTPVTVFSGSANSCQPRDWRYTARWVTDTWTFGPAIVSDPSNTSVYAGPYFIGPSPNSGSFTHYWCVNFITGTLNPAFATYGTQTIKVYDKGVYFDPNVVTYFPH